MATDLHVERNADDDGEQRGQGGGPVLPHHVQHHQIASTAIWIWRCCFWVVGAHRTLVYRLLAFDASRVANVQTRPNMNNSAMLRHLPMRVLALNQYYAPDASATAQLLTDLCEDLVKAGDEVRVVASRVQGDRRLPAHECIDGVEVVRPWSTGYGKGRLTSRFLDGLSFVAAAASRACVVARPDVILALSAPPMVATAAALAARGRELPLVHWVHDVYPDIALATGVLPRRSALGSTLQMLSRVTHRHAAMSIAVSSKMAEILKAHGQSADRVRVQENWADGAAIQPRPTASTSFRARHGLKGRFVVMYSGNLGLVHDIATPIRAAHELSRSCPDVVFVFVGAGARLAEARELAGEAANIRFLPAQPRGEPLARPEGGDHPPER